MGSSFTGENCSNFNLKYRYRYELVPLFNPPENTCTVLLVQGPCTVLYRYLCLVYNLAIGDLVTRLAPRDIVVGALLVIQSRGIDNIFFYSRDAYAL